jgi:hypothetical protein
VSLLLLGIDPGLRNTGLCLLPAGQPENAHCWTIRDAGTYSQTADTIAAAVQTLDTPPHAIGIEDFQFRSPRISHGLVKHAAEMGKLIGRLSALIPDAVWVPAHESKALQPEGKPAQRLGIPGRNDHERSAYYVALWLAGTLRLAGGLR